MPSSMQWTCPRSTVRWKRGWRIRSSSSLEAGEGVDEHPGLGLEGDRHAGGLGLLQDRLQGSRQAVKGLAFGDRFGELPRPERDALGPQLPCQVDGPAEEVDPDGPAGRVRVHQRRVVLEPGIEQVPRPGLDDPGQPLRSRHDRTTATWRARTAGSS